MKLRLDKFAFRQWDDVNYVGSKIPNSFSKEDFMSHVLKKSESFKLVDGYAPFCKHIFVPNFIPGLKAATVEITDQNKHLIESDYQSRTEKELPVLCRWISREKLEAQPDCKWLDLILYSKEQIVKECQAMKEEDDTSKIDYDWGIISIKAQNEVCCLFFLFSFFFFNV